MFTGIIKEIGEISAIERDQDNRLFSIKASSFFTKKEPGASIAVDGTCLTLIKTYENTFVVEAIPETLTRSICGQYIVGSRVNLEGSLCVGDEISGHFVSGHIDRMAKIISIHAKGGQLIIEIAMAPEISQFLAFKGSIAVNGISLTVSGLQSNSFEVAIIPFTADKTNLTQLKEGMLVNLEVDSLARYAQRISEVRSQQTEYAYLVERGFI